MTVLLGANYTDRFSDLPAELPKANSWGGRVRCMSDSYAAGVLSVGDKIKMGRLPKGARIVEAIFACTDLGTTGQVDLGYQYVKEDGSNDSDYVSDDNAFLNAVDVNAKADSFSMSDQDNMVGFLLELSSQADVEVTVDTATDAAGTIKVAVFYVLD